MLLAGFVYTCTVEVDDAGRRLSGKSDNLAPIPPLPGVSR
jgi:hypothetical protein